MTTCCAVTANIDSGDSCNQYCIAKHNLRSGVIFFPFFFCACLLWLEREKITPDTFI